MLDVMPMRWAHFRTWDYHPSNVNPILFLSLSPSDECFIWHELNVDPKKNTTEIIAEKIIEASGDYKFKLNRIDPLAGVNQPNTSTTVIQDLNRYFSKFKKEGFGTGGKWEPYDTKYHITRKGFLAGRDNIKRRLINSVEAKKPFNNNVVNKRTGFKEILPTLWVSETCRITLNSLYKWRMEDSKPSQKWSHHCTALEGIMKEKRFKPRIDMEDDKIEVRKRRFADKRTTNLFKM
jgi:hypothetical protein